MDASSSCLIRIVIHPLVSCFFNSLPKCFFVVFLRDFRITFRTTIRATGIIYPCFTIIAVALIFENYL